MKKQFQQCVVAASLAIALTACGSKVPRPTSELALANSALEDAERSGARDLAPIQLRLAREKKAAADKAIAEKSFMKAKYLTVEARTDAELARAAADAEKSRRELKRAQDNIELLRSEAMPTSNSK
ncbi:MAG: DUF4398 domain-containing protein [Granulosicoccus sp.]